MDKTCDLGEIRAALEFDPLLVETPVSVSEEWHGRVFAVELMEVDVPGSGRGSRELVRHDGGAAVVAVREGRVCLVRQYRVALGRMTLEVPAGRLEPGEKGADAAARELREETGLVAGRMEPLLCVYGSPGFTNEHTDVFLATDLTAGEAAPDEGELVSALWLPLSDVLAAIEAGLIQDGKTVSGVLAAARRLGA